MTNEQKKRLTEYIGECPCYKKNELNYCEYVCPSNLRTFDNWADLGVVFEKMTQDEWIDFSYFVQDIWMKDCFRTITLTRWILRPIDNGKIHFCRLMAEWLGAIK